MSGFSMVYVIYAAAALTGIMIAEAFYMLYAGRSDRREKTAARQCGCIWRIKHLDSPGQCGATTA